MNIIIISSATYPHQSPRAMRTHELSKELAKKHKVTLYVQSGTYNYTDYEKQTNIKVKPLNPMLFSNFEPGSGMKLSLVSKTLTKLFKHFTDFPDIEFTCKTYSALKETELAPQVLITIGRPHPIHWGVALFKIKNKSKLKETVWIADCGDPFMGNPFNKHAFYFKYIEQIFCKKADFITVPVESAVEAYYPQFREKIKIIPQGFDITNIAIENKPLPNAVPTFIFAGTFYRNLRDPIAFLKYLVELSEAGHDFVFVVYTKSVYILEPFKVLLGNKLVINDFIPRSKLLVELSSADFLINIENASTVQTPSKLIDYIIAERPVCSFKTDSDDFKLTFFKFLNGNYEDALILPDLDTFDIKNIAKKFIELAS